VVIKLVPPLRRLNLSRLKKRKLLTVKIEDIVSIDWSKDWKPGPV
jgi:hypothetical protein